MKNKINKNKHYLTSNVYMTDLGPWSDVPFEELNAYERYLTQGNIACCISVVPVLEKGKDIIYDDMLKKIFYFTKNGDLKNGIYYEMTVNEFHEQNMLEGLKKEGWIIL